MAKSVHLRDKDGFIILRRKPGVTLKNGKASTKIAKTPEKFLTTIPEVELMDGERACNIGDYVMDTGIVHALNMNVGRHIPWIEDGLKTIERRVLYCMYRMKLMPNSKFVKVAGIDGEVVKCVHPHGDDAVAETIYRLGRKFSMMIPYIDGHGNFGNMNTKKPAAPRYTEARLSAYAADCFFSEMDLAVPIYDEKPNYTYDDVEPVFLPSKYPNTLLQYNMGIGKGASTNIVAFNSRDIFKVAIAMIDDPDVPVDIYPDTPVPLDIVNKSELKGCFDKKEFKVRYRGRYKTYVDKKRLDNGKLVDKYCIEFEYCPMNTYGEILKEAIIRLKEADNTKADKLFPEIINVECAGDEEQLRLVVEYERGYDPQVLAEKLYRSTALETTYGANFTLIKGNKPERYSPREIMKSWIDQRYDQKRRYYYQKALMSAKDKARYDAYCVVLDPKNIDKAVDIIKKSKNDEESIEKLRQAFDFTRYQAGAVIKLRLSSLSKMNADEIRDKAKEALAIYKYCREMLSKGGNIKRAIKEELEDGMKKYGRPRLARVMNLKDSGEDPDTEKILVYNDTTYFCLDNYDKLSKIANKIDKSYDIIKITNGSSVLIFGEKGVLKVLDGYAFSYTEDGIDLEKIAFSGVVKILKNESGADDVALITKQGYGKVMAFIECTKSVKGKVINLNNDDILASVVPVRKGGIIGMVDGDKLYYVKKDTIPVLKRTSAGNRLIKGVSNLNIQTAFYTDDSTPFIMIYGESGYAKVLDTQYLGFAKRGNNCISFQGKSIYGVVPIDDVKSEFTLYDAEGKLDIKIEISDKIKFMAEGMKPASFARSTSIGAPTKVLRKGKYEFYKIR